MSPSKPSSLQDLNIPQHLIEPLWLRSQESLKDDGLIYDPIAARACFSCQLAPQCLSGNLAQKQLLNAAITQRCDRQISQFLCRHPEAWIINIGAGLDTRFYRLDNGRCRWIELDITEHLLIRQKLFHPSERYEQYCGQADDLSWLPELRIPDRVPVLIVCETALLDFSQRQVAQFVRTLAGHFNQAHLCMVLAGDLTASSLGEALGCERYAHGFSQPAEQALSFVPWAQWVRVFSPFDSPCSRWKYWHQWLVKLPSLKHRLTPVVVEMAWSSY